MTNLLTATRQQLDLRDQAAVNYWFRANRSEYVFLVAGTVGGILANATRPAEFLYDNMMIHATVVHASHLYGVRRLLYLGSSCIYPRDCAQPIKEKYLLTGPLEPTNEAYAIAKIAGTKLHDLGWRYRIELREGIAATYSWFVGSETAGTPSRICNQPLVRAAEDERIQLSWR